MDTHKLSRQPKGVLTAGARPAREDTLASEAMVSLAETASGATLRSRRAPAIAAVVVLLVAFALRAYHLSAQSLWYDEAFSNLLAGQDLASITSRTAADIHPPLYYYLLHFWIGLAGTSEFALRFFSLFWSVGTVPLLWRLAEDLRALPSGKARREGAVLPLAGIVGAALAAIMPAYVWYGQEARMYSLLVFLSVLLLWLFVDGLRNESGAKAGRQWWRWVVFVLVGTAAAYTHFYALFVVAAIALLAAVWWLGARMIRLRAFLGLEVSCAAVALAYIPWAGFAMTRLNEDTSYYQGALNIWEALRETATLFSAGHTIGQPAAGWVAAVFVLLFTFALLSIARSRAGRFPAGVLIAYVAVPVLLIFAITYGRPKFHPRYLLLVSPAVPLAFALASAGLERARADGQLRRWARRALSGGAAVAIVASFALSLANSFGDGRFARDDWRAAAEYIEAHAGPADEVILISGHAFPAFAYYYARDNWTGLPEGYTLSIENTLGYNIANTLNRVLEGKDRLWVLRWQADVVDPNDFLGTLLSGQARRLSVDRLFQGLDLQYWEIPPGAHFSAEPAIQHALTVDYDHRIKLLGFDTADSLAPAGGLPRVNVGSGGMIALTIYWQALTALDRDYAVSLRIKDDEGHFWGRFDRRPTNYFYPTPRWKPGEIVFGRYAVPVLAGTPPGEYVLEAEVYSMEASRASGLNVLGAGDIPQGTSAPIARVRVDRPEAPPATKDLRISKPIAARLGDLDLLGYEAAPEQLTQGSRADFTVFWQVNRPSDRDPQLSVRLTTGGKLYYETRMAPVADGFPAEQWAQGDRWRRQIGFTVPANAPAGESQLEIAIVEQGQLVAGPVPIQKIRIVERPRRTDIPADIQRPMRADLAGLITFLGYDLGGARVRPGDKVKLTLYWQARGTMDRSYTVFTHLLDGANHIWGQRDGMPVNGTSPTTGWVKDEVIVDVYEITVDKDAPVGNLDLEIGMYDAATLKRLAVDGKDDRIVLGQVQVQAR